MVGLRSFVDEHFEGREGRGDGYVESGYQLAFLAVCAASANRCGYEMEENGACGIVGVSGQCSGEASPEAAPRRGFSLYPRRGQQGERDSQSFPPLKLIAM